MSSVFEAVMLLCFGLAWPFSIYRSYKSRKTAGKSLFFLIILQVGYVAGILFKVTEFMETQAMSLNIYLYSLNLVMITIDEMLYFRNRKIEESESK